MRLIEKNIMMSINKSAWGTQRTLGRLYDDYSLQSRLHYLLGFV